jgi:hypothetical protein
MGIMTFPAGEAFTLKLEMNAFLVLGIDFLEVVFRVCLNAAMAIEAVEFLGHPQLARMREGFISCIVAIDTGEGFVVRLVKIVFMHNPVFAHECVYLRTQGFIGILVLFLSVAFEAKVVLFRKLRCEHN